MEFDRTDHQTPTFNESLDEAELEHILQLQADKRESLVPQTISENFVPKNTESIAIVEITDATQPITEKGDKQPMTNIPWNEQSMTSMEKQTNRKMVGWIAQDFQEKLKNGEVNEESITHLEPKRGKKVIINQDVTNIRYIWDQFEEHDPFTKPYISFNWKRFLLEFFYNYFHILAFPWILYYEGIAGFVARDMLQVFGLLGWLSFAVADIVYIMSDQETRTLFWYPLCIMNLLHFTRILVLAVKYGYYVPCTVYEYKDKTHKISYEYILSLLLIPGWIAQNPLTLAREIWMTEQKFMVDFKDLRMNFRDTKAFDMYKSGNCSCSRYWTKLDWFIPFVYVYTNTFKAKYSNIVILLLFLTLSSFYAVSARLLPWSQQEAGFDDCDSNCYIIICTTSLGMAYGLANAVMWSLSMSVDFSRRFERMKLCTHLLDPKRDSFQTPQMRVKYKVELFGSVVNHKKKLLESLDLHTIDCYSADTVYAWSLFRKALLDIGFLFLLREQAYNAILLVFSVLIMIFFLLSVIEEDVLVIWEDLLITLMLVIGVLLPSMWTMSCENSLNYQTMKQQRILSERALEMYHFEKDAKEKGLDYWVMELKQAREMCEAIADSLSQNAYFVTFLGIKVDFTVLQMGATLIGLLFYVTGMTLYEEGWFGDL